MKKRILIIGSEGFSGTYLNSELKKKNSETFLIDKKKISKDRKNYFQVNMVNYEDCRLIIKDLKPNQVYNLSGSYSNIFNKDFKSNVVISMNLINALMNNRNFFRLLLIGSSAEYGYSKKISLSEKDRLCPISNYGLVKSFQTKMMIYYFRKYNIDVLMARPFSFVNRDLPRSLLIGNLYNQIRKFKENKIDKIELGNLDAYRDFIDVRKAVQYYIKIMEKGESGEIYNVGSGKPILLRDMCKKILKEENIKIKYLRENQEINSFSKDVKKIYANINKLKNLK